MTTLQKLESEKLNLSAMSLDINEAIQSTELHLKSSFTGKADTDQLSQKLAILRAKLSGLVSVIESNDKSLDTEHQHITDEIKAAELEQREQHVLDALESLDRASKLHDELAIELQKAVDHNSAELFRNHSEIEYSVRGLLGRLALQFKQHGSLQMSTSLPVPTVADYDRLVTHINQF